MTFEHQSFSILKVGLQIVLQDYQSWVHLSAHPENTPTLVSKFLSSQFWLGASQSEATSFGSEMFCGTLHCAVTGQHTLAAVDVVSFLGFLRTREKGEAGAASASLSMVNAVSAMQLRSLFRIMDEALAHCT